MPYVHAFPERILSLGINIHKNIRLWVSMMTKAGHRARVGCFEAFLGGPHHLCMLLRRENVQTKVFSLIPLPKENEGELFTSEAIPAARVNSNDMLNRS